MTLQLLLLTLNPGFIALVHFPQLFVMARLQLRQLLPGT
jgi:hypothetical protein